jgi:hypothetical protein
MDRLCGLGQVVEYREVPGANHDTIFGITDGDVRRFLADRLAGVAPTSSCPRP